MGFEMIQVIIRLKMEIESHIHQQSTLPCGVDDDDDNVDDDDDDDDDAAAAADDDDDYFLPVFHLPGKIQPSHSSGHRNEM